MQYKKVVHFQLWGYAPCNNDNKKAYCISLSDPTSPSTTSSSTSSPKTAALWPSLPTGGTSRAGVSALTLLHLLLISFETTKKRSCIGRVSGKIHHCSQEYSKKDSVV